MADNPNFKIVDPRPRAARAPYTFFLPREAELVALRVGDFVKIAFEWELPVTKFEAERMWVSVLSIEADILTGVLENEPSESGRIHEGASVTFRRSDALAIIWADPPPEIHLPDRREYWERCLVDDCVLYEDEPVEYLYREAPHMTKEADKFPDSGWRIRGRRGGATDEEMEERKFSYVALGAVLNKDDSWLSLIDAPVGADFMRDFPTGRYSPQK